MAECCEERVHVRVVSVFEDVSQLSQESDGQLDGILCLSITSYLEVLGSYLDSFVFF